LFGIPESKDSQGTRAWAEDGVVQRALRRIEEETDVFAITDVCLCEYTDHGHCGVLEDDLGKQWASADGGAVEPDDATLTVDNDRTLELLGKIAESHAAAGADMVAPSSATDGM